LKAINNTDLVIFCTLTQELREIDFSAKFKTVAEKFGTFAEHTRKLLPSKPQLMGGLPGGMGTGSPDLPSSIGTVGSAEGMTMNSIMNSSLPGITPPAQLMGGLGGGMGTGSPDLPLGLTPPAPGPAVLSGAMESGMSGCDTGLMRRNNRVAPL
jgi:hypothetical protein